MRCSLAALACLSLSTSAFAVTGDAPPAADWAARAIVMIVDTKGDLCTGTALARDFVLTAAHCVARPLRYEVKASLANKPIGVRAIARHPDFDLASYAASRATADVALIKLAAPLPDGVVPAKVAPARRVLPGEQLIIAGFGSVADRTPRGLGVARMAKLAVTGKPGSLQIRLYDPATRDTRAGLGACVGDSGGPAFDGDKPEVIGIISWTTAPHDEDGCGGLTGLTPLLAYRAWIVETAAKLNSQVGP